MRQSQTDSPIKEDKDENKGRRDTENVKRKGEPTSKCDYAILHFGINKVTVSGASSPE